MVFWIDSCVRYRESRCLEALIRPDLVSSSFVASLPKQPSWRFGFLRAYLISNHIETKPKMPVGPGIDHELGDLVLTLKNV